MTDNIVKFPTKPMGEAEFKADFFLLCCEYFNSNFAEAYEIKVAEYMGLLTLVDVLFSFYDSGDIDVELTPSTMRLLMPEEIETFIVESMKDLADSQHEDMEPKEVH
jgi:hypothetical protein